MSGNEIEIRITSRDSTDFDAVQRRAKTHGDKLSDTLGQAGQKAGAAFSERFIGAMNSAGGGIGSFFSSLTSLASSTAATGGLNLLIGALLALTAASAVAEVAIVALAPAMLILGGSAGATTTLLFGLIGSIAVLGMGLGGLGDAWSAFGQAASGGGQSAAAAGRAAAMAQREVKNATDALADAQRNAAQAQLAVTKAREDEAERLEDLSRNLAGARLDEEGALLAVQRAEERLRQARRSGSVLNFQEAELGYRQAVHSLEEVRDRVGDLAKEQQDGARKGVEGSDAVQAALQRQQQAQRSLEQATWRLADAQRAVADGSAGAAGGVDKFAEAMAKLSPNGRALINTLIALKPRFDDLKKSVQDRLLAGFDTSVKDLATKWLPALGPMLGGLADKFNIVTKRIFGALGKPQFISDIQAAMGGFGSFVERLGSSLDPLIGAFGRLARASVPFLGELGDLLGGMFEKFSKWIESADKSGALTQFMADAAQALRDIWDIGGLTIGILGEIVEILFPASKRESDSVLAHVKQMLSDVKEWLADPENQKKLQDWIERVQDFGDTLGEWAMRIVEWTDRIDGWIEKIDTFVTAIGKMPARIRAAAKGMFDGVKDAFRDALNGIIDRWNNLSFRLPSVSFFGAQIGGGSLDTPDIPRFAHGGIGGGLARVAERGRELIDTPGGMLLALPQGSRVHPNGTTEAMLAGGGSVPEVRVVIDLLGADEELHRRIRKLTRVYGGGRVEVAFGK